MVLPTSMALSGNDSLRESSSSLTDDATTSFKLFMDLITPAEFSKLLRARVSHLLNTWPPKPASTISAHHSPSSAHSNSSHPSFESVRAFAAFFRTQDSPGPSPIDLTATTSLQALHKHLLALQTLLSFLSGRELQDIVRARLTEGGKDRSIAVQGLMDIMRNLGGDEIVGRSNVSDAKEVSKRQEPTSGDAGVGKGDGNLVASTDQVPLLNMNPSKRKISTQDHDGLEVDPRVEDQKQKRQRVENNAIEIETANEATITPIRTDGTRAPQASPNPFPISIRPPPSLPPSIISSSSSISSMDRPEIPNFSFSNPNNELIESRIYQLEVESVPTTGHLLTTDSRPTSGKVHEKPVIGKTGEYDMKSLDHQPHNMGEAHQTSDEEDEKLIVTLIDTEVTPSTSKPQPPTCPPNGLSSIVDTGTVTRDAPTSPSVVSPAPATSRQPMEGPSSLVPQSDSACGPGPGVSRAEWNRKRFRAALGLPPKEPENIISEEVQDTNPGPSASPALKRKQSQYGNETSRFADTVLEANQRIGNVPTNSVVFSNEFSFNPARARIPVTPPPPPNNHTARSRSSSFDGSDLDNRASPPGPVLRAVDWASRVVPSSTVSEMEVDELDEQDGLEDTIGNGATFDTNANGDESMKPTSPVFSKSFSYRHTQMLAWPEADAVVEDEPMWEEGDEQTFDNGTNVDDAENLASGGSASGAGPGEKLFIRLPARKEGKEGETGIMSTGTEISVSASVSASPAPPSPSYNIPHSPAKADIVFSQDGTVGVAAPLTESSNATAASTTESKIDEQSLVVEQPKTQTPPSAAPSPATPTAQGKPNPTEEVSPPRGPSRPRTQLLAPNPHMQIARNALQHAPLQVHGQHPHPYGPPHAAFPGPWFGAMFYVPFRGPPHVRTHPHVPPPHPPLHHPHSHQRQHPHPHPHMLSHAPMQAHRPPPKPQNSTTPVIPKQSPEAGPSRAAGSENASASASGSGQTPATTPGPRMPSPPVAPPEGPKKPFKKNPGEASEEDAVGDNPDVTYTDEVGVKESATVRRRCFNCLTVQAPSWRKSKLSSGKILCNKCGIYESTHMTARPLKTRPRRSNGDSGFIKKRKSPKKVVQLL